jgi:hypothetical protein
MRLFVLLVLAVLFFPLVGWCETYGIKDADGGFTPKVAVGLEKKEIIVKKINPRDKFRSLSLRLNPANRSLIKNVALLQVEWIGPDNKPSKPTPFAGPLYDRTTHVFQDSLVKSIGLKLIDKSTVNLFAGKKLSDILLLRVDDVALVSAESVSEKERTVQMGTGRDVSLNVDKTSVVFNEGNLKRGEIINVDNRSGLDQVMGVDLPAKGFVLCQIRRRLEQTKIPKEDWDRFTLPADQGIFIVLIPEPDPAQLTQLDGREIVIKSYQGNEVRETRRIPIEISSDLRLGSDLSGGGENGGFQERPTPVKQRSPAPKTVETREPQQSRQVDAKGFFWLWVVLITNLVLLVGLAFYALLFLLPRVQVLQDRVSKSEMFIHGSREAIREELEQIKRELVEQYLPRGPEE